MRTSGARAAGGLRSLGGGSPPPGVAGDLRAIEGLPKRVRDDFWEALAPNLGAHVDERTGAAVAAFCEARRVTLDDVAGPVKACRFLFRQAAANNLKVEDLRADVQTLCGEGMVVLEDLLSGWYERALPALRQEILMAALAEHGNLATGVDWRLDVVQKSHSGVALNTPVVMMTFRYREGAKNRRITLQFVPSVIKQLQDICNSIMT